MEDVPDENEPAGNFSSPPSGSISSSNHPQPTTDAPDLYDTLRDQPNYSSPPNQPAFQSQLQQQFHPQYQSQQNIQSQSHLPMSYPQIAGRDSSFNMGSLGTALPDGSYTQDYPQQPSQRFPPRSSTTPRGYQLHQNPQYLNQSPINQPTSSSFPVQYSQQYQGMFGHPQHSPSQAPPSGQRFVVPPPQQAQQFFYPGGQYASQGQPYQNTPLRTFPGQYGQRNPMQGGEGGMSGHRESSEYLSATSTESSQYKQGINSSSIGQPSTPRGPPRKPKQSGHALWVGNLPPGANVIDLKEHFSRDATDNILSVFLISKSNCAFVNYRTEESCAAAMSRFQDSRFQGVRLVCRLRRSSVNAVSGVPIGPSASSGSQTPQETDTAQKETESGIDSKDKSDVRSEAKDRYFIVKSLTVEDLELSVRNGTWATQSHNEEALNEAYENAEAVYLIFSANKSGEYFGYARMISPINNDPAAAIEFAPKATAVEDTDLPKAIPTAATESAPQGRIIDDSARGTIFWEAEFEEPEGAETDRPGSDHSDQEGDDGHSKAWGKPFKVEWQSTNRLPFYRTRGLRNPWNSNREVKIARDGTELETSIGRRLVHMFHREASPSAPTTQVQMPPMMGGYPQMRY